MVKLTRRRGEISFVKAISSIVCSFKVLLFFLITALVWDAQRFTTTTSHITSCIDEVLIKSNEWVEKSLLRYSGTGWTINQVPEYPNYKCKWLDFTATSGKKAKFCGHSDSDVVTRAIESQGKFHHCDVLPKLWEKAEKDSHSIYLEIGANIGSCVMEMLLSTDARIVLFEPHPKNLFCISNTISVIEKEYQDRVVIVPIALGAESASNTIFAAEGNMGNSIVGKIIKDNSRQEFPTANQHEIFVERLDSIISPNVNVPLTKMDAQGFECNILSGMNQDLADALHLVKFEVARGHLRSQGCNDLLEKFREKGFSITHENGNPVNGEWQQFNRMMELHAVHNN